MSDTLARFRGVFFPPRPRVLNFQVNDICSTRCVMCNIWKNKRDREITAAEFSALLRRRFFREVRHVGITGGEPTLRTDIGEFYATLPTILPKLESASFITNGFRTAHAVETYSAAAAAYRKRGLHFSGMVSIDGVGEIHNIVRGRPNAWANATETLSSLRQAGVDVHACCTVIKANVWHLHELLDWGDNQGIYIRFRVGEFINRLYNQEIEGQIRAFDEYEIRHLVSFFHLLIIYYEKDPAVIKTYTSIISILTDGIRLVGCPYQSPFALNLDSTGRFAICALTGIPRPIAKFFSFSLWNARKERETLIQKSCSNCIHDYHFDWTPDQLKIVQSQAVTLTKLQSSLPLKIAPIRHDIRPERLVITGWYGTETAGDIAILGGILLEYKSKGYTEFYVTSLYPFYSRLTLIPLAKELAVNITITTIDTPLLYESMHGAGRIIMAGGPLMDIEPVKTIRALFRRAGELGIPCDIVGCGLGPLVQPQYIEAVTQILQSCETISLRDQASQVFARRLAPHLTTSVRPDPSKYYIKDILALTPSAHKSKIIRFFLRELTCEYTQETTPDQATALIINLINKIHETFPDHELELCAMHWFPVGWDDREYARKLKKSCGIPTLHVDYKPRSPREIAQKMISADINICMRFHSVVFAHTLGAKFIPVDYTDGGKIHAYFTENKIGSNMLNFNKLKNIQNLNWQDFIC